MIFAWAAGSWTGPRPSWRGLGVRWLWGPLVGVAALVLAFLGVANADFLCLRAFAGVRQSPYQQTVGRLAQPILSERLTRAQVAFAVGEQVRSH